MPQLILNKEVIHQKIKRLAIEVLEKNTQATSIVIIGIAGAGDVLAKKIYNELQQHFTGTLYLDTIVIDKKQHQIQHIPKLIKTAEAILLVDDVANTGAVLLAAVTALWALEPKTIQTLALVERTHKLFPIAINFVGSKVASTETETIVVTVENNDITGAYIQ